MANVFLDFKWSMRGVVVRKTGAYVPFDHAHLSEVFHWIIYFFTILISRRGETGPVIGFLPDQARPWYLIWPSLYLTGGRAARNPEEADIWMHFEDSTISAPMLPPRDSKPAWNFKAHDLSKSRVAEAFEEAFGYPLTLDPEAGEGPCVEKGEANGVHDGQIVTLPCAPKPGKVYQRLIDNRAPDGLVEDLRTPTVGGVPVCVYIKRRDISVRFSNDNLQCKLEPVDAIFSSDERAAITRFCKILELDWGGLDILRDATSGLIYIVDANRTDMGPPISLPLTDKIASTYALAAALQRLFKATQPKPETQ